MKFKIDDMVYNHKIYKITRGLIGGVWENTYWLEEIGAVGIYDSNGNSK